MEGRKNSPFTKEKETWIILKFGELKSLTSVRRLFRKEFNMNPKDLPTCKTFSRVIERFKETGNVQPRKSPGEVILHWFEEGTVNQWVYLDMLETVVWPRIKSVSTRRQYVFQQDGATCHTTLMVRDWLFSKFGERIISRHTPVPWPARSPDLSPLDFWFWSVCLAELRRNPPSSLDELKETVEVYSNTLEKEEIIKACRDILPRADACIQSGGGAFEYKLKKIKRKNRSLNNEE